MTTVAATICHHMDGRLRIKVPSRRDDAGYFSNLESELREKGVEKVKTNPLTGNVVIESDRIDIDEIAEFASGQGLFELDRDLPERKPLFAQFSAPVQQFNRGIGKVSGGDFDLPGLLFMALLGFGAAELIRGNFRTPPWYTAFWYAFGIFSKSLLDRK